MLAAGCTRAAGSAGALLQGTLAIQDGCLVVIPSNEGAPGITEPVVPVIPISVTTWDGTTLVVGDATATIGSEIALGGGFSEAPPDDAFVPQSCPSPTVDGYFTVGI